MRASSTPSLSMRSRWATVAPNIFSYHSTAASRSRTAMPTWSISVSLPLVWLCMTPEQRDAVLTHLGPEVGVVDAEAFLGGEAQHADLALVQVVVDLVRRLARLLQRVDGR